MHTHKTSMENLLKPYDKEFVRMAILKHEETFKEQVNELHRLYRIQKLLMRNIGSSRTNTQQSQELWNSKNNINFTQNSILKLDLERPAEDYAAESSGNGGLELIEESEIELTLGPSNYSQRRRTRKPDTPLTSDSGPSFSSSSTGSSRINKISSVNHQILNKKAEESDGRLQVPDMTLGYQNENKASNSSNIDVDERLRQERLKQPPWLFQVLSLNIT